MDGKRKIEKGGKKVMKEEVPVERIYSQKDARARGRKDLANSRKKIRRGGGVGDEDMEAANLNTNSSNRELPLQIYQE